MAFPQPPQEIQVSRDVYLVAQPEDLTTMHAMKADKALRLLRAAKGNNMVMQQLRGLLPVPSVKATDDEVLQVLATRVSQGLMELQDRTLCTTDKRRFFNWVEADLQRMAKDLGTTKQIVLTLAVKEGGWNKPALDHNQPLNNPFGVNYIKNRQAAGNKSYKTLQEATEEWADNHSYVKGVTDPDKFVKLLLEHHYNTVNPNYAEEFMNRYVDVGTAMLCCGIKP